ncbi:MAG: hypothetical protein ACLSDR_07215, partial [Clostridium sp.]
TKKTADRIDITQFFQQSLPITTSIPLQRIFLCSSEITSLLLIISLSSHNDLISITISFNSIYFPVPIFKYELAPSLTTPISLQSN